MVREGSPNALAEPALSALTETRERTLELVDPLDAATLESVYSPLLSPFVWDLGHIAAFEDLWISRALGEPMLHPELTDVYDADETPRSGRGTLPLLRTREAYAYLDEVRERTLAVLGEGDERLDDNRLELILRHEQQHNETILQGLQLAHLPSPFDREGGPTSPSDPELTGLESIELDGGNVTIGADPDVGFAYDNERPQHVAEVGPFRIGVTQVSNAAWLDFVQRGGYERRAWWSDEGWAWRVQEQADRPLHWTGDGRQWRLGECLPLPLDEPVIHISFFEAEAFASSHGARLPTEFEWELAATWDHTEGRSRIQPWGAEPASPELANVDQRAGGPVSLGSHPDGASPSGVLGMIGDAWEWTSSHFAGYPGFVPYPYREYSEQFFGTGYRVLRGGSWATRPRLATASFRNWDLPQRRQIFSGLRLAWDVS